MRLIQIGIIALILLIALAIDRLQRQLTRALGQLVPALSNWARGDFNSEVRIATRIREIDDIETSLNQLRTYLLELVGTLRKQATRVAESSRSLDEMSSSLHDGASARPATPRRFATRSASWRRPSSRWPMAPAKPQASARRVRCSTASRSSARA